jgi:hypothetical protein
MFAFNIKKEVYATLDFFFPSYGSIKKEPPYYVILNVGHSIQKPLYSIFIYLP